MRVFPVCLICLIHSYLAFAQTSQKQADSLLELIQRSSVVDSHSVNQHVQYANLYCDGKPDTCLKYARIAAQLSQEIGYDRGLTHAYVTLFNAHYTLGSHSDSLLKYAKLTEDRIPIHQDVSDSLRVLWQYGVYYGNIGKQDKELDIWLKALALARRHPRFIEAKVQLLNNIAIIVKGKGDAESALAFYKEALATGDENPSTVGNYTLGNVNLNIAETYIYSFDSLGVAAPYLERAQRLFEEIKDYAGICYVLSHRAEVAYRKGKVKEAERLYFEALSLVESKSIGSFTSIIYNDLSSLYFNTQRYELAVKYGEMSLTERKQRDNYHDIDASYQELYESYAKLGNYKRAYELRNQLAAMKDSLSSIELKTQVAELEAQFLVDQKEIENKLLKAEKEAAEEQLQSRTYFSIALLLGLLLVGSWALVMYRSGRQKAAYSQELETTVKERTAELQDVNKDLEQANKELRTFNFIASHDIKEPVRNVGNYVGLMFRKLPTEVQKELNVYFEVVQGSVNQLYDLIGDLARYSSMSRDAKIEIEDVDLQALVSRVEKDLAMAIDQHGGKVFTTSLPTIKSSPSLLYHALKNLIENGLKFNESHPPVVEISHAEFPTYHALVVQDNGIGIQPAYYEQVFEMFKRLHPRDKFEGSGIGLAIVKLMMDKLGGTVSLESERGKGSMFVLHIPK